MLIYHLFYKISKLSTRVRCRYFTLTPRNSCI